MCKSFSVKYLVWIDMFQFFKYCSRISTSAADLCNIGLNASLYPKRKVFSFICWCFFCCLHQCVNFCSQQLKFIGKKIYQLEKCFLFFPISKKRIFEDWYPPSLSCGPLNETGGKSKQHLHSGLLQPWSCSNTMQHQEQQQ